MNVFKTYSPTHYQNAQKALFYQAYNKNQKKFVKTGFGKTLLFDSVIEMSIKLFCVKAYSYMLYFQFIIFWMVDKANTIPP